MDWMQNVICIINLVLMSTMTFDCDWKKIQSKFEKCILNRNQWSIDSNATEWKIGPDSIRLNRVAFLLSLNDKNHSFVLIQLFDWNQFNNLIKKMNRRKCQQSDRWCCVTAQIACLCNSHCFGWALHASLLWP